MSKYKCFNELHKKVLALSEEVGELHREVIMDGTISEIEINNRINEIEFILTDSIGYQFQLIRNLIQKYD